MNNQGSRRAKSAGSPKKSRSGGSSRSRSGARPRDRSGGKTRSASDARPRDSSGAGTRSAGGRRTYTAKSSRRKRRANPMLALLGWLLAIALAFGISYFVKAYGFEVVRVNGDAMAETMMDGDLVLVTKFDYKEADPERFDVVVMKPSGRKGVILRRIVGMPGETVEILAGETHINGSKLLEQHVGQRTYEDAGGKTLPTNRYYVMSDNRTQFSDSRNDEIGLVEADNIVGKARWVIWPLSHLGGL